MNYLIFGGTGFVGTHLINLIKMCMDNKEGNIYALDIVMPGEVGVVPGVVEKIDGVHYIRCDVREEINIDFVPTEEDIIFNLAAVHRTPGHPDKDYFETNILGAENIITFAEKNNIKRILFTSSIAPYGASEELKEETTIPMPNIPYGISKLTAEKIHEKWQVREANRSLTILRPGVVFGKGENGNFTRMFWGIKKGYFFYAGRKDTVKACIYVKELVEFMKYRMMDNDFNSIEIFNCTYEPAYTIEEISDEIKRVTGLKRKIMLVPGWVLKSIAICALPFGGKKLGLHPDRVKKLMISTRISGIRLASCGYSFKYTFNEAITDWYIDCDKKYLL